MTEPTPHDPSDPVSPGGPSRRAVLRVVAATGAGAAVLAACGGDTRAEPGASDPTGGGPTAGGESSPGASSPGGSLVATADVPVGGGVVLEDRKVVVTQPTGGEFKAFTAVCTHQACTVASVKDDRISCPCHGSAFSGTDGSVVNGPATRPLREIAVAVEGGQVVET